MPPSKHSLANLPEQTCQRAKMPPSKHSLANIPGQTCRRANRREQKRGSHNGRYTVFVFVGFRDIAEHDIPAKHQISLVAILASKPPLNGVKYYFLIKNNLFRLKSKS